MAQPVDAAAVATEITTGRSSLLALIQSLEGALVGPDPYVRGRAVDSVADVLTRISSAEVSEIAASTMTDFFIQRLSDVQSVPGIFQGLNALLAMDRVTGDWIAKIPQKIFQELSVQTFPQTVRFSVFKTLEWLLVRGLPSIQGIGSDFVAGLLHAIDGEKDPRNLLLVFGIVQTVIAKLDFTPYAEDISEMVFCYFPINFSPPPNDPNGISGEDLRLSLRKCISGSHVLAKFAVPLLLEKLSSSGGSAKLDAMETITACAPVYAPNAFVSVSDKIWDYLKEEIVKLGNEDLGRAALETLHALVSAFSKAPSKSKETESPMQKFIVMLMKDVTGSFVDPEHRFVHPCQLIFASIVSTSPASFEYILKEYGSDILEFILTEKAPSRRKTFVITLVDLLKAHRMIYSTSPLISSMKNYKDKIMECLTIAVVYADDYPPLRDTCLIGIFELILTPNFLEPQETQQYVVQIYQAMMEDSNERNRDNARGLMKDLAGRQTGLVRKECIEPLLSIAIGGSMTTSVEKAIVDISQPDELFVLSLSHLTNHACSQIENGAASQMDLDNVSTLEVTLPVIISLLKNQKDVSEIRVSEFVRSLDSIGNACYSSIANEQTTLLLTRLVDAKYYFLWSVVEYRLIIVTRSQERIVTSILSKLARPFTPSPFTVIFTAILGNVQRESVASTPTWETFVREMVDAATSSQSLYNRHIFISAASLLNKCSVGTLSVKITENIQLLKTGIQNGQNTSLLMPCFAWLTKALVIQANQKGYSFLGDIISWLSDPSKASFACDAFELIIRDDKDGYLSIKSSCVSKLLFKQRLFNLCLPSLLEGYDKAETDTQQYYLACISHMLRHTPKQIWAGESGSVTFLRDCKRKQRLTTVQLFPLLLKSLVFNDAALKLATLEVIQVLMKDSPQIIAEHISSVVPSLLKMTIPKDQQGAENSITIRIKSCETIGLLKSTLEYAVLHPYRVQVIKGLLVPCDDHKRLVRQAASNARNKWMMSHK